MTTQNIGMEMYMVYLIFGMVITSGVGLLILNIIEKFNEIYEITKKDNKKNNKENKNKEKNKNIENKNKNKKNIEIEKEDKNKTNKNSKFVNFIMTKDGVA